MTVSQHSPVGTGWRAGSRGSTRFGKPHSQPINQCQARGALIGLELVHIPYVAEGSPHLLHGSHVFERRLERFSGRCTVENARVMLNEGRRVFRFETFGDEAFWGDTLKLHQAIAGSKLGVVGPGVSPRTALSVGLKVDVDAVPPDVAAALTAGNVDLDDPASTMVLLKANAVMGITGHFGSNGMYAWINVVDNLRVLPQAGDHQHHATSHRRNPQHRRQRQRLLSLRGRVQRSEVDDGLATRVSDALIDQGRQAATSVMQDDTQQ